MQLNFRSVEWKIRQLQRIYNKSVKRIRLVACQAFMTLVSKHCTEWGLGMSLLWSYCTCDQVGQDR